MLQGINFTKAALCNLLLQLKMVFLSKTQPTATTVETSYHIKVIFQCRHPLEGIVLRVTIRMDMGKFKASHELHGRLNIVIANRIGDLSWQ